MAERPTYVVDASVATKWVLQLPDEAHTQLATTVRRDFEEGRTRLIAPDHLRAEIGHALLLTLHGLLKVPGCPDAPEDDIPLVAQAHGRQPQFAMQVTQVPATDVA
ncbi:MAG: hypothetical protein HY689_14950, partial [Chloroflexi bacterium]|nr:hypothetical protein [Chloroflexota bacterium]